MEKNYKTKKEEMKNEKTAGNAVVFENPEFGKIRTLTDEDGEPLFCAKDVCDILGYKNQRDAIQRHVEKFDVVKRDVKLFGRLRKDGTSSERFQQMLFVNESGFYALVLGSKLPTAVKFKNWVTSEVLPQIRKTGGYIPVKQGESDEETIPSMFLESHTIRSACLTIPRSETFQYLRTGALHLARFHSWPSGFTKTLPPRAWILFTYFPKNGPMRQAST